MGFQHEVETPNMTGNFRVDYAAFSNASGAFHVAETEEDALASGSQLTGVHRRVEFSASRVSSLYNGTKMQSPALSVLPCIRI